MEERVGFVSRSLKRRTTEYYQSSISEAGLLILADLVYFDPVVLYRTCFSLEWMLLGPFLLAPSETLSHDVVLTALAYPFRDFLFNGDDESLSVQGQTRWLVCIEPLKTGVGRSLGNGAR